MNSMSKNCAILWVISTNCGYPANCCSFGKSEYKTFDAKNRRAI